MSVLSDLLSSVAETIRWIWYGPRRDTVRKGGADPDTAPQPANPAPLAPPRTLKPADPNSNLGVFRDKQRNRDIPFRLYAPARAKGPAPVILFSHGHGGSRDAAPYLGEALARAGYFAFFLQHPGSDESLLEGAATREEAHDRLRQSMQNFGAAVDRFRDIPVVLDHLMQMNPRSQLAGRLDLTRIGIAGHSFGARVVMTAAGQRTGLHGTRFKEPRIKAGVLLSPNVPTGQSLEGLYDEVDIPLLHVTGTEDGMPLSSGGFDPAIRTKPFELIDQPDQYLLVLDGATHGSFSGRPNDLGEEVEMTLPDLEEVKISVATATVLFFDAYLKNDPKAKRKLREEFRRSLNPGDRFKMK